MRVASERSRKFAEILNADDMCDREEPVGNHAHDADDPPALASLDERAPSPALSSNALRSARGAAGRSGGGGRGSPPPADAFEERVAALKLRARLKQRAMRSGKDYAEVLRSFKRVPHDHEDTVIGL